jgi:hypothetical protein
VILVSRLLCWAEKYQAPYPKLLGLAGILCAVLVLALRIAWAYIAGERNHSQR